MQIVPLLKTILDAVGLDPLDIAAQVRSAENHMITLHDRYEEQILALIAPDGMHLTYFNIHFWEEDDVLTFEFITYMGDGRMHVDFRTEDMMPDGFMHYMEVEMSPGAYHTFTPWMLQAIEQATGPLGNRMPDANGKPMSTVATLPPLLGDLVIDHVSDAGRVRFDAEGDRPAWSIPYLRAYSKVTLLDLEEDRLPIAA